MMELYEYFHWAYEDRGEGLDLLAAPGKDLTMYLVGQVVYAFTHVLGNLGKKIKFTEIQKFCKIWNWRKYKNEEITLISKLPCLDMDWGP